VLALLAGVVFAVRSSALATCTARGLGVVRILDSRNAEMPARMIAQRCYVEIADTVSRLTIEIGVPSPVKLAAPVSGLTGTQMNVSGPRLFTATLLLTNHNTQLLTFHFASEPDSLKGKPDTSPSSPATNAPGKPPVRPAGDSTPIAAKTSSNEQPAIPDFEVYVAWVPSLTVRNTGSSCMSTTICLSTERQTSVLLTGTNLQSLKLAQNTARLVDLTRKDSTLLSPSLSSGQIRIDVTAEQAKRLIGVATDHFQLAIPLQQKSYDANDVEIADYVLPVTLTKDLATTPEMDFTSNGQLSMFSGESRAVNVRILGPGSGPPLSKSDQFDVVEGAGSTKKLVASLQMFDSASGRLTAIGPTTSPILKVAYSELNVVQNDNVRFHTHLQVSDPPHVEKIQVDHTLPDYTSAILRPQEHVTVTLSGTSLRVFDGVDVLGGGARLQVRPLDSLPPFWLNREILFDLDVSSDARQTIPILLHSNTVKDTTILISVGLPQRAHDFSFTNIRTFSRHWHLAKIIPYYSWEYDSATVRRPTLFVDASSLNGIRLNFDPGHVDDPKAAFGPQYIVADITLNGPDGSLVARDSVRTVIVPRDTTFAYAVAPGFDPRAFIDIDALLKRVPRYASPGSYLEVSLRHDPAQYERKGGAPAVIRITKAARYRVTPRFDVLTGLTYLARLPKDSVSRLLIPNGAGADTIVSHHLVRNLTVDFLDVTAGAAAALDVDWLRTDFRPSWLRARIAVMAVSDPFQTNKPRRFAASVLYPIEITDLRGGLSLSLAIGYGRIGSNGFMVVAPGVGFTLPKL
jgi:hypothetical protein